MTDYRLRAAALDEEGCAAVHDATITLLEHTGVEVQHDEALALLKKAGARVDGTRAKLPRAMVDDALFSAPRSIPLTLALRRRRHRARVRSCLLRHRLRLPVRAGTGRP